MMKDIGALWNRTSDKGEYMTGIVTIGGVAHQIVAFKNGYKKADNQPDWRIYPSTPKPELNENGTEKVIQIEEPFDTSSIPF